jgi:DNA-binding response OmpR family regulator
MRLKKVLIIDDEEDFCFFVRENLNNTGQFEVFVATNGTYGVDLARNRLPDIILLDLMMPGVSGEQVVEKLKETPETALIPRIFLTALATREDTDGSVLKKSGASYFIAKPVRTKELVMAINEVLAETTQTLST